MNLIAPYQDNYLVGQNAYRNHTSATIGSWKYLITESGDHITTEAGDRLIVLTEWVDTESPVLTASHQDTYLTAEE